MKATPMRREYGLERLDEATIAPDPVEQFRHWFEAAEAAGLPEPNAMTLATATPDGRPSARVVLLKAFGAAGFAFFTNFESRKGAELAANPHAALVFFWAAHERQVRIEGRVERVAEAESDAYFAGRPLGAQRGAWVSEQSRPVADRAALEARLREVEGRFGDGPVPRPPHWGGFRVVPEAVEFWQGRPNRLHDRLLYRKGADGWWTVERLAP